MRAKSSASRSRCRGLALAAFLVALAGVPGSSPALTIDTTMGDGFGPDGIAFFGEGRFDGFEPAAATFGQTFTVVAGLNG